MSPDVGPFVSLLIWNLDGGSLLFYVGLNQREYSLRLWSLKGKGSRT